MIQQLSIKQVQKRTAEKEKASESGETLAFTGNRDNLIQNTQADISTVKSKSKAVLPDKERELLKVLQNLHLAKMNYIAKLIPTMNPKNLLQEH